MTLELQTDRVHCTHCGYVRTDDISGMGAKEAEVQSRGQEPAVQFIFKGEIKPTALAAFESGQDALFAGNREEALRCFQRAAEYQDEFTDAHLWIAKTSDDEQVKRNELGTVLALAPEDLEATRILLVLDGKLTPE